MRSTPVADDMRAVEFMRAYLEQNPDWWVARMRDRAIVAMGPRRGTDTLVNKELQAPLAAYEWCQEHRPDWDLPEVQEVVAR